MMVGCHGNTFPYILNENTIYWEFYLREHNLKSNFLQFFHKMFCKDIAELAVAMECIYEWQPCDTP